MFVRIGDYARAREISYGVGDYIRRYIELFHDDQDDVLHDNIAWFYKELNSCVQALFNADNTNDAILCMEIMAEIGEAWGMHSPFAARENLLLTLKNIGDIYFLVKTDYSSALERYIKLLDLCKEFNCIEESVQYDQTSQICEMLGMTYVRCIDCYVLMEKELEAIEFAKVSKKSIAALAEFLPELKNQAAYLVLAVGSQIEWTYPSVVRIFAEYALELAESATTDIEENKAYAIKAMQILENL